MILRIFGSVLTQDDRIVVMRGSDGKQLLLAETKGTRVLYLKFCIHCLWSTDLEKDLKCLVIEFFRNHTKLAMLAIKTCIGKSKVISVK